MIIRLGGNYLSTLPSQHSLETRFYSIHIVLVLALVEIKVGDLLEVIWNETINSYVRMFIFRISVAVNESIGRVEMPVNQGTRRRMLMLFSKVVRSSISS